MAAGQMLIALTSTSARWRNTPWSAIRRRGDAAGAAGDPRRFRPHKVVALRPAAGDEAEELLPLLAGKTAKGAVTTYVCRDFACQAPLVGAEAVEAALGQKE